MFAIDGVEDMPNGEHTEYSIYQVWSLNNQYHRIDGPAYISNYVGKAWYLNDVCYKWSRRKRIIVSKEINS